MTFDREAGVYEALRKDLRKFAPLPVRESRRRGEAVQTINQTTTGVGAYVHLSRNATQSIASGGAEISWDTEGPLGRSGFSSSLPATSVTIPQAGYYNIAIQLGWSSFTGGGTITVRKNGIGVWPPGDDPGLWSTTAGSLFEGTAPAVSCQPGDTLSVFVNPDDASSQTLASATLAVYLVDLRSGTSSYAETVLADAPVGYWRLGESSGTVAVDETGNNDATYTGSPTQGVSGLLVDDPNLACQFAEATTGDYVGITGPPAELEFLTGDFSVEFWCQITDNHTATRGLVTCLYSTGGPEWGVTASASGGSVTFFGRRRQNEVVSAAGYSLNTTYHIVLTYNDTTGDEMILYVDGVAVDSGTDTGAQTDTTNPFLIGAGAAGDPGSDSIIDEVALYNTVLTPGQVDRHYQVGKGVA